jgi:hypothetical protein
MIIITIYISWNMLWKRLFFYFSNVYRCFTISLRGNIGRTTVHPPPRLDRARPHLLLIYYFIWYILSLFLFAWQFSLSTPTGGLSWGFEWWGPAADGGSGIAGEPKGGSRGAGGQSGQAGGSHVAEGRRGPIGGPWSEEVEDRGDQPQVTYWLVQF